MLPKIYIGEWVDALVVWATDNLTPLFDAIVVVIQFIVGNLTWALTTPPPWVIILLSIPLVWYLTNWKTAVGTSLGLLLIYDLRIWEPSMNTLSMVIAATIVALLIGIPLGILTARSNTAHKIIMPLLDFMQTMPPFVYLIPAVLFLAQVRYRV